MSVGIKVSSLAVADLILRHALDEHVKDMTNMKLNKLVYIAHGWHLGVFNKELVEGEKAEAWPYGPVFPKLYCHIKLKYLDNDLHPKQAIQDPEFFAGLITEQVGIKDGSKTLVRAICSRYLTFSATELVELTHRPVTPWHKINSINSEVIPNEIIQEYYIGFLDRQFELK